MTAARHSLVCTSVIAAACGSALLLPVIAAFANSPASPTSALAQKPAERLKVTDEKAGKYEITYTLSSGDKIRLARDTMIGPRAEITGDGGKAHLNSDRGWEHLSRTGVKFTLVRPDGSSIPPVVIAQKGEDKITLDYPDGIQDPEHDNPQITTMLLAGGGAAAAAGLAFTALRRRTHA
ncbi:hypothetical protein [Streptomyces sp. NPDC057909]|uniref:hypothetical protein n=1 Tax=Streptomyces sp. NPDC057909 TaxID=3346277 RepID=UPI0036EFB2CF